MKNIDIYNNRFNILQTSERKIYFKFVICLVTLILICIFLIFIKYPKLYKFEGHVVEDKIVIQLSKDETKNLKGNVLKIKDKEIKYEIYSFSKLDYDINYIDYYLVTLLVNEKFVNNEVVDIIIEDGMTNLYESFIKKLWKGF